MALIANIIGESSFERIRNRIGEIIATELAHQYYLDSDETLNANVWIERFVKFDATDCPSVNVRLATGDYSNQHQGHTDGEYLFNIDFYTSAPSTDESEGDTASVFKLQKLMAVCRYILDDPQYKTLGFTTLLIMNRNVRSLLIDGGDSGDNQSVAMGRLVFAVKAPESNVLLTPTPLGGVDTLVRLSLTNKGYVFTGSPFTPPINEATVNINNVFFSLVESGKILNIEVTDQDGNLVGSKVGDKWVVNVTGGGSATVQDSDASYDVEVDAGDTLVLPDTPYEVIVDSVVVNSGNLITLGTSQTITINL
jgi:hypothetical protein